MPELIAAKLAAGRHIDLADAEKLAVALERKQKQTEEQKSKERDQGIVPEQKPTEGPKRSKKQNRGKKKGS